MNLQNSFLNRTLAQLPPTDAAPRLRLLLLVGLAIATSQFADPLGDVSHTDTIKFWSARLAVLAGSLLFVEWLCARLFRERLGSPAWLKPVLITMAIAIVPMTIGEMLLESWFPQQAEFDDTELLSQSLPAAYAGEYLTLASVLLPINFLLWVLIDNRNPPAEEAAVTVLQQPAFLAKAGAVGVSDVLALEAEEHYVRVHTGDKAHLVHHRLRDAMADMPARIGTQVHRSWWVAHEAISETRRDGRRHWLILANGTEVPVSDQHREKLKNLGVLV